MHLTVLSAFALSQPLLDILGRNPTFFSVRDSSGTEIVLFVVALVLVPPVVLFGAEAAVALASPAAARALHLLLVCALLVLVVLHALTSSELLSGAIAVGVAVAVGAAATALYARADAIRSVLSLLAPAPVFFAVLFLFTSQASDLVFTGTPEVRAAAFESRTSVVLVVFDELSTVSLMDGRQRVDARRFPNFAALARDATWFRSATTEFATTEGAVPSLLTGRTPQPNRAPVYAAYPRNIFTLLGKRYRMRAIESLTSLCPKKLCTSGTRARAAAVPGTTESLVSDAGIVYLHLVVPKPYVNRVPAIDASWGNFGGRSRARRIVGRGSARISACDRGVCDFTKLIDASRRPTLYLLHTVLPHVPYEYLPSGRRYAVEPPLLHGTSGGRWTDRAGMLSSQQRYLLQLGYADRALGLILRRLRATGTYDRSLVIATADHGVSYRMGEPRRSPTLRNLDDIAFVPLFVKLPGQKQSRVVDSDARTIDVVPTIARVLGADLPWKLDGRPLVGGGRGRSEAPFIVVGSAAKVSASLAQLRAQRARGLREQIRRFGTGSFSRVYRIGPAPALVGRRAADFPRTAGTGHVELDGAGLLEAVDPASGLVPTYVSGSVSGLPGRAPHELAIAANGRIAGTTSTYERDGEQFSLLVPETALRRGRNAVEVFVLQRAPGRVRLQTLSGSVGAAVLRERDGTTTLERAGQAPVTVNPAAFGGAVTAVRKGASWVFSGWAADLRAKRSVETLLVLVDGREVFRAGAHGVRPQRVLGHTAQRQQYSFEFALPAALLPQRGGAQSVRVFAVRGRVASEPGYGTGYPWSRG